MSLVLFLYVLVMAAATCTPIATATGGVTLSADAEPIPGGYVVPERGNITFTCNSSSGRVLWTVDLRIPGHRREFTDSVGLNIPQVSSMDVPFANPTSFTIHKVTSENNQSFVECSNGSSGMSNATIIVEGSPNCPAVHTTVNTVLLTISIQKLPVMWLPKWYYVEVSSYYNGSIAEVYNSTLKGSALFDVTPLQPGTVYNISVIPCNMAGCNESCDIHSVQTMAREPGGASRTDFDITFIVIGAAAGAAVLVVLATCMVTTAVAIIACTLKRKKRPRKSGGGEGHYEDIVAVEPPYNDLVSMSMSLQYPNSPSVDAVNVRQASFQLHSQDAISTTAAPNEESVRGVTSSDVTMEDNPAYQPMLAVGVMSATMTLQQIQL